MTRSPLSVSIIIPALNEQSLIRSVISHAFEIGADEVIVADGGSTDATPEIAAQAARLVTSEANRGVQMNAGARVACGDALLFLHADARLGKDALNRLREALGEAAVVGGNFDIRYEGGDLPARVFTVVNRLRRRFGILYGDSGIFCRRALFEELGGYRPYPVLEDYEFARRLWKRGKVALLEEPIFVSARRWRHSSLLRTLWSWFWIQGLYLVGVSPERLARMYRHVR